MFSVRIISVDHYQSMPTPGLDVTYSQFRGSQVKQVPVIRIFGTTPSGQKTCLHVHGVFPYFYIPYDGSDESARLMYQIAASLDKAINISLGHSNSNAHHVFKIVQVSGKPFYGYHSKEHQFLKIFLYNPLLLKRAVDLLQNGVICNRIFQPHEAHIPFILQFFIDYNLYGMNFIDLKSVVFRFEDMSSEENVNNCESVNLVKESLCELEADAVATDILNRLSVSGELAVNPGLAAIWEDEKQRRGEGNELSQQESQPRPCRNPTISEILLKEKLKENLKSQGRNSGQRSVLQEIPYPAETQEGSNILNASTLDTHHMLSLQLPNRSQHEESIVNEELVLSLTSTNDENALTSQDKSMVNMLMELVEMNAERRSNQEVLKAIIDHTVEDDSILGSQILVENVEDETLQGSEVCGEGDQCHNSPSNENEELLSEHEEHFENQRRQSLSHHSAEENSDKHADDNETNKTSESGVQWDDTFWEGITDEDIPQLDGAGDILFEGENCSSCELGSVEHSDEDNSAEYKIDVDSVKSNMWDSIKDNWCNEAYDFSVHQSIEIHSETDESDYEPIEDAGSNLTSVLRGNPSFTSSAGCSDELTCSINKSCDNSVIVPKKELENSSEKNSSVCTERVGDNCDAKQNVWKETSESDLCKTICKEGGDECSTNAVPSSDVSISEIEGCENVCDGIVCSEPLCYDNLLGTSPYEMFGDNLTASSFIEYQKVEPGNSTNKRLESASHRKAGEHTAVVNEINRFQKGKLKIKFNFCKKKKLSRKKIAKSCKSRLILKAFNFIDDVTEDMVNAYFSQIEKLKQQQSNENSKKRKRLINLSWSKISVVKSRWKKRKCKQNSVLKTLDMNMSLTLGSLSINSFDSDIRELLPCSDTPDVSSEPLCSGQASPFTDMSEEISSKAEAQNCRNCVVRIEQLTGDNISKILKHYQLKSPDMYALQPCMSVDSLTHELQVSKVSAASPVESQSCKTECTDKLKPFLNDTSHKLQLSGSYNNNFSCGNCISTKSSPACDVPEETVKLCNNAVVIVSKLNTRNLENVCWSQSKSVTSEAIDISNCFVKLEKIECCEEKNNFNSELRSENRDTTVELEENIIPQMLCKNMRKTRKSNEFTAKLKSVEKDCESLCSVVVKCEKLVVSSLKQPEPNINKNNVLSRREKKCTSSHKRSLCQISEIPGITIQKDVLRSELGLTDEISTLQRTYKKACLQVRNVCDNKKSTLKMLNIHNIQYGINSEKNHRKTAPQKENKRVNEKGNQMSRGKRNVRRKNKFTNIVCIDGTYDGSSSDSCNDMSCDSQQNSSCKLTQSPQTPKRRRQVSSKQGTPKHRYEPLSIEIKKSPTSKCVSYEQKNNRLMEKSHTELRVLVEKDDEEIRKAINKRPSVDNEPDTSADGKTEILKKIRLEKKKSPMRVPLDVGTSADSRTKVVKKARIKEKTACLLGETGVSSDKTKTNRRVTRALRLPELRVCLHRLSFKHGKPVVEDNSRLTRSTTRRINDSLNSPGSTDEKRHHSTEAVIGVPEEENPSLPNTGSAYLHDIKGSKNSETASESVEDANEKKTFSRARKRLQFPKCDKTTTSQIIKDSRISERHHKKRISHLSLSDSDSSSSSLVTTQKIRQNSKSKISVCDENLVPTCLLNKDLNTDRKDHHKSQGAENTSHDKNVDKAKKKLYVPDYDAQPSTSHGVNNSVIVDIHKKNIFDESKSDSLFMSLESTDKLSQNTNPSLTESNDILTLGYSNLSDTEFNAARIHADCESDKGIVSFYNSDITQNITKIERNEDANCEKVFKLCGFMKPNTTYTLSRKPPSRYEVCKDLPKYGFPEVVNKEPFVSNPADVVKGKEVGGKVLKLTSKSIRDLEEFESDFSVLSKWQDKFITDIFGSSCYESKIFHTSSILATDRRIVITPLKQAPTVNEAKFWYNNRLAPDDAEEDPKEVKVSKIVVPSSPGHDVDEDETSVSLTPSTCSSSATKVSGQAEIVHSTPHASDNYRNCVSPVCTPIVLYDKICFKFKPDIKKKPRRRSSLMSHVDQDSLPLIMEEDDLKTVVSEDSKTVTEEDSKTVTEEDSKTVTEDGDSKTVVKDNSKTIIEDNSTSDCNQIIQDENSMKENTIKEKQKPAVHTKLSGNARLCRRLSDLSKFSASTSCQLDVATPDNSGGYKMALENLQCARSFNQHQYLTVMSVELHVATRGELRPDPECDAIRGIFYHIINDAPEHHSPPEVTGIIIVGKSNDQMISSYGDGCVLHFADTEQDLLLQFVQIVRKWDPDIFIGFEIEMLSWGFLIQRAYVLSINMNVELSRVQGHASRPQKDDDDVQSANEKDHEIRLIGRIVLNGWRLFRHEVALQSYTFENLMYHILHRRIPLFSFRTLTLWWDHRTRLYRWMTVEHYLARVVGTVKLLVQLDLFQRTSELARLFGIQFYEVLSRGSQFRVESMMLRLAKPLNYVPVSPSIKQRAHMRAPGCLPLIMEPESRFYSDPVIVLDFQSLYPSMIIAYNYCFSTCMGRVDHLGQSELFEFGCTQLRLPFREVKKLEEELNFSPCGVAFVKSSVRKGILPRMLEEILNTRLMVKKSMKKYKDNKVIQRVLESRQLGLKLIANVTYGYTAANFSGRMPCSEVADSVVSKGRETLERAISLVKNTPKWGAKVVYGDTDSMFVLVPGKDRKEAFRIGAEIAEAVTNDNPPPVKLKLEKVFQPCILQTKKRYVGYMYECPDEEKPVYNAKGIETVRRDGCPAVAKILEKSLKLLFETKDVSLVKNYATRQFSKILLGRLSIQELIFAREYRGASGYRPGACVPALELAKQWLAVDPRSEPRVGERVPYVITAGPPGLPLIRSVRSPQELLADPALKINSEYYITKVIIPPLDRCFSLIGAQVHSWYSDLPRKQHTYLPSAEPVGVKRGTISQYFATVNCVICQEYTHTGVCSKCQQDPQKVAVYLADKLSTWERRHSHVIKLCQSCCGRSSGIDCTSLDCPVLYMRYQAAKDLKQAPYVKQLQREYLSF